MARMPASPNFAAGYSLDLLLGTWESERTPISNGEEMVYDSAEIETRWQARWRDARVFDAK